MTTALDVRMQVQTDLGVKADGVFGNITRAAYDRLASAPAILSWPSVIIPTSGRHITADGLQLVKEFEGLYLTAYLDEADPPVWTIGYGHTGLQHNDGTVHKGRVISMEEALNLLAYDMQQFEGRVKALVTTPLTDDQFSALVAFDFNTGGLRYENSAGHMVDSTMLQKLNEGDFEGAADEFPKWNHAGGKVLDGLTRRRLSEQRLFRSERPFIISLEEFKKNKAGK